jgi:hypothetical protein
MPYVVAARLGTGVKGDPYRADTPPGAAYQSLIPVNPVTGVPLYTVALVLVDQPLSGAWVVQGVTLAQAQTWVSSHNNLVVPV